MKKIILNKQQIVDLIFQNRYPIEEKNKFLSRCIDGRYDKILNLKSQISNLKPQNLKFKIQEKNLPALAIPGGDLGELALILATGNTFGFEVDGKKAFKVLSEIVGGEENFHFHTDNHNDLKIPASGCGHWKQIQSDPTAYHLTNENIKFINSILTKIIAKNGIPVILKGEHKEGAILMIKGNFGIYPKFFLETDKGKIEVEVFVYHQSLVDERHRLLVKKLIEKKAAKLYPGCDEEYLYQVLSDEGENHLFETLKRLAQGLPIFKVEFDEEGRFEIEEIEILK